MGMMRKVVDVETSRAPAIRERIHIVKLDCGHSFKQYLPCESDPYREGERCYCSECPTKVSVLES